MGTLELNNLVKTFSEGEDEVIAVDNIDITVEDGEFLVLVGPSGCGKSTTLRSIAGLETTTSGEIILDGKEITDQKPKNRNIAMVFQNYALYPHMTAQENMSFGLRMTSDLSEAEIDERVEGTAAMMGIESLLDSKPGELSGGQQQRVALGRAIVREPKIFLMDEPLSNLDAKLRANMRTELQELHERLDVTTIYVTHDQTEAMTMGDRIAILNGGELQQIGTPLDCYHSPANQFVAGFIGSPAMNFFDVTVSDDTLIHDDFRYQISSETADKIDKSNKKDLVLGIRPEDIRPAEEDDVNSISIVSKVIEPMGDLTYLYFDIGDTTCVASISGDRIVEENSRFSIVFPEDRIHLFDKDTEEAIKNSTIIDSNRTRWG